MQSGSKTLPRDARLIALIMASLGVDDAEPGTLAMLLEFTHRWTADLVADSLVYHEHTLKSGQAASSPTTDDLRVAVQAKIDLTCTNAWPKEYLQGLAQNLNKLPLPEIRDSFGINLPAEEERLTNVNFDLRPKARPLASMPIVGTEMMIPAIEGLDNIEEHVTIPDFGEPMGDDEGAGEMDEDMQYNGNGSALGKRDRDDDGEEEEEE